MNKVLAENRLFYVIALCLGALGIALTADHVTYTPKPESKALQLIVVEHPPIPHSNAAAQ